jgi:hypothetical protein
VNITFTGTSPAGADTGSFTSTGTVGTGTWNGSGNWSFTPTGGANPANMTFDSASTYAAAGTSFIWDKHFLPPGKLWAKSTLPDGSTHIVDSGTYVWTLFGVPLPGQKKEISDWIIPAGNPRGATVTVSLTDDRIFLTSGADFTGGTTAGTISTVPEPTPIALLGILGGLAGAVGAWRRRAAG